MQTIDKKSTKRAWAGAIAEPAKEFPLTQLSILSGKIPEGLRGTLVETSVRNSSVNLSDFSR